MNRFDNLLELQRDLAILGFLTLLLNPGHPQGHEHQLDQLHPAWNKQKASVRPMSSNIKTSAAFSAIIQKYNKFNYS